MNPNVFDLDIDPLIQGLAGKIHLPGTTRTKPKNSKSKGVNKRELHEIDSAGLGTVYYIPYIKSQKFLVKTSDF